MHDLGLKFCKQNFSLTKWCIWWKMYIPLGIYYVSALRANKNTEACEPTKTQKLLSQQKHRSLFCHMIIYS